MKKNKKENIFAWLHSFTKQYTGIMYAGIVCAFLAAGSEIVSVYALEEFVNHIFCEERKIYLNLIGYAVILLAVGSIAKYFMIKNSRTFAAGSIAKLKSQLALHMQKSLIKDIESKNTGQRVSEFTNNINLIERYYSEFINTYLYTPLMVVIVCIYLLIVNWKLLLISVCVMPISVGLSKVVSKPMEQYAGNYFEKLGEANNLLKENIEGVEVVKSFTLQNLFQNRYHYMMKKAFKENMKLARQESLMMPFVIISYELPYVVCAVAGGYLATYKGSLQVGDIVAFLQLLSFLVNPMSQLSNIISDLSKVKGTSSEIKASMENELESDGEFQPKKNSLAIEFKDVSFGYNKDQKVLEHFTLKLEKNKKIALVGRSGSGKSTILNLISGFCFSDEGSVSVLGQEINASNIESARKYISRVDQDTFLFNDTIRQNILYGNLDASEETLNEVLRKAELDGFINELPQRLGTVLNENGKNVSGGQRQRLAIARAFIKNAPILILDEPTASLDGYTQEMIQKSIEELAKGVTTITVAHRLSTIKDYDEIIVMHEGRIIERGSHKELLDMNGYYKQLYQESEENNE